MAKAILVKQVKSKSQCNPRQKATLKAIGLTGVGSRIHRKDTRALRGMLNVVRHLIEAEQTEESKSKTSKTSKRGYSLG